MADPRQLEARIEALLADEAYAGHPLRAVLAELYAEFQNHLHQLERVTRISDRYQSIARQDKLTLTERYRKQLRQLERIARISDRYQLMLRDVNQALQEASTRDPLTGLANRRLLIERLKAELARHQRGNRTLSIALADVDRFKAINDNHGHEFGDKVLIEVARLLESSVREYDLCGRWGGEEFLIAMLDTGADAAAQIIDRLRLAIAGHQLQVDGQAIELSASFGIAQCRPGDTVSDVINRADTALYAAKRAGRNRWEMAHG